VCPLSFIDRRRVRWIPHTLHKSKALKHGHCRVRTSSIGAICGDNEIWIYVLTGSLIIFNNVNQIASDTSSTTLRSNLCRVHNSGSVPCVVFSDLFFRIESIEWPKQVIEIASVLPPFRSSPPYPEPLPIRSWQPAPSMLPRYLFDVPLIEPKQHTDHQGKSYDQLRFKYRDRSCSGGFNSSR
jgi:hypothetical protein